MIPTLDACDTLGPTVATLFEGVMDGLVRELVISDGGSTDGTDTLAEEVGARFLRAERGRGAQLAAGADAAEGEWLLFLHADTRLSPGWPAAVRAHIETTPERAGYGRLRFRSTAGLARMTERWANGRSRLFALPYGDQGLLISRRLYAAVGGYPTHPLMEDVALARKLGRQRLNPLDFAAETSAARYEREGWVRRGAGNLLLLARYTMGADPERLAARYRKP